MPHHAPDVQTCQHTQPGIVDSVPPQISLLPAIALESVPAEAAGRTEQMADQHELSLERLIQMVVARNPSVAQMVAAWQAASARYPQVTSLEDPMFAGTVGPESFGSRTVNPAYRLEISQKYPAPGKLRLRGENALAEAGAAGNEVDDIKLQLVESAKAAFYDYYLVHRSIAVNDESVRLLNEFRQNAESRFRTGQTPQQDVLQATVEIGREEQRRVVLERQRRVAVARLNTLMHVPPDSPLPPPPTRLALEQSLPEPLVLRTAAVAQRPDLKALANRIAAEEAALALAYKEYCPDVEPFLMYDRFMGNMREDRDLATQIGVKMNLPVRLNRRAGAIAEAHARIAERRAQLARQIDQVHLQVQEAYEQIIEGEKTVRLYEKTIFPAAQANVKAALTAYATAKIGFLSLLEAQRNVVMLQERYYEALSTYHRQRAALERAVGGSLLSPAEGLPIHPEPLPSPSNAEPPYSPLRAAPADH